MVACYCGSGSEFEVCCGPVVSGDSQAQTAEALMRARYSAFVTRQIDFLHASLHPEHRQDHDVEATRRWAEKADWLGLQIVNTQAGGTGDEQGSVEFIATYKQDGVVKPHHEISRFSRQDGVWYYVDGDLVMPKTNTRDKPKVGRNDPCPCGSGKKFKKCCGAG
jgi:SEC-C motif-containing protein